jgi:arginase
VLGGDHSISIATVSTVAGWLRESRDPSSSLGLLWVDAHPDLETPDTDSTNDLNAMAAAHLLDRGVPDLRALRGFAPKVKPENLIYIGLRDVVSEEREAIQEMGITAYTASDVEKQGIVKVCEGAFGAMEERTDGFVLSFDIDAVDPSAAPGVDYPEPGGLTMREAMVIMEFAFESKKLSLFEILEVNPTKDREAETSKMAVVLIYRLLRGPVL